MGEKKKSKNEVNGEHNHSNKQQDGATKEGIGNVTVVLKTNLPCDCEGCASKLKKDIRSIKGVESVIWGDGNKLTVIGEVDPVKLREKVEQKTGKKVELISPVPKKDNGKEAGAGDKKKDKPKENSSSGDKKSKEVPITTAVMKLYLHCAGCIEKFQRIVTKKGCQVTSIDRAKNLVTVTGSRDMKALAESLKKQLKKEVEIVPAKKEGGGGGGGKDGKKEKGGGDEQGKGGGEGAKVVVGSNPGYPNGPNPYHMYPNPHGPAPYMYPHHGPNPYNMYLNPNGPNPYMHPHPNGPNPYNAYVYGSGYPVVQLHAPQLFSDENPNACSIL